MAEDGTVPLVAVACGGTGGHFFPGLAVAERLRERGWDVRLLVSRKEVDQRGAVGLREMEVTALPAVACDRGRWGSFVRGFVASFRLCRAEFRKRRPAAVLGMGGFTSAPPILAARLLGAPTFLHEANAIPGRANRWLAHVVDRAFVFFPEAVSGLAHPRVDVVGMPVRTDIGPLDPGPCRLALGLEAERPVLLVMGGSQGARGINDAVMGALPRLHTLLPAMQFLHLTGAADCARVQAAHAAAGSRAVVRAFLTEMDLALGSATVAISRAGASSLAEFAAARVPSVLIPYPSAADNHQYYNALALEKSGAARLLPQSEADPERLANAVVDWVRDPSLREAVIRALAGWYRPDAAERVAREMSQERVGLRPRGGGVAAVVAGGSSQVNRAALEPATLPGEGGA